MTEPSSRSFLAQQLTTAVTSCRDGWRVLRHKGPGKVTFWFIALLIGIAAGFAALFFRKGIYLLQETLYGTDDVQHLHIFISGLDWYLVVLIPTFGGLVSGLILHHFTHDARARSVADVIEGAALHDGRVETRAGLASALASMVTLGTGGLVWARRASGAFGRCHFDLGQSAHQCRWNHWARPFGLRRGCCRLCQF